MTGWKDGALHRFVPYAVYASTQISNPANTIDNRYNMIAAGRGTGILYNYDLRWPQTNGAVGLNLSRVKIAFQDKSTKFQILVSSSGNRSEDYETVYQGTSSATLDRTTFQSFDFVARPVRYVKIRTPVTNGYLNLAEVQFFGTFGSQNGFVHPGILLSQDDIDDTYDRVAAGYEPQKSTYARLVSDPEAARDFQPSPMAALLIHHGGSGDVSQNYGHDEFVATDSEASYKQALMWITTRDPQYAENVIGILDAWGSSLKSATGGNMPLESGWALTSYLKAAEIVKHTYGGWDPAAETRFLDMVDSVLLPDMEQYTGGNSNVWFTRLEARLHLAILTDNRHQYDRMIQLYKDYLAKYVKANGQLVELTRDVCHANMALNSITQIAETARHQGQNLYAYAGSSSSSIVLKMLEYQAGVYNGLTPDPLPTDNNGNTVWPLKKNCDGSVDFAGAVGIATSGHEIGYNHYVQRLGWSMPQTKLRVAFSRQYKQQDYGGYGWGWSTLTHGEPIED